MVGGPDELSVVAITVGGHLEVLMTGGVEPSWDNNAPMDACMVNAFPVAVCASALVLKEIVDDASEEVPPVEKAS